MASTATLLSTQLLRCSVTVVVVPLLLLHVLPHLFLLLFVNVGVVKCQPAAGAYLLQLRPINNTK